MRKYQLTKKLAKLLNQKTYEHWLYRKARTHLRRDRARGNKNATGKEYRVAIHEAVCESKGRDAYTGEKLDWSLLSKYNNADSKKLGREYKHQFAMLPSVDHVGDGLGKTDFKICSWRTNDAKNDLSYKEFVKLCKKIVNFSKK